MSADLEERLRHIATAMGAFGSIEREAADAIAGLRTALSAASGYLLNAKIDLETGAPKRTAIATIEGGLKVVRAALDEHSPKETTP